jgi:hypothetical protein
MSAGEGVCAFGAIQPFPTFPEAFHFALAELAKQVPQVRTETRLAAV